MGPDGTGCAEPGAVQHGRPEQGVEIDNVLADKVVHLGGGIRLPEMLEINAFPVAQVLETGEVTNGRVEPDVEVLAGCIRNLEAEIGRIAADVPFLQTSIQPLGQFIGHLGLQRTAAGPVREKVRKFRQAEEVVLGFFVHRRGTGDRRAGIDQLSRGIGGATGFAVVAVLVFGLALGAGALNEPVRQEHVLFRIERLGNLAGGDVAVFLQLAIDVFRELAVLFGVGGVIVVEADVKTTEILLVLVPDTINQVFGRDAFPLGTEHNGSPMSIVRANVVAVLATHFLIAHPDIRLNVFQQMAQVDGAIGVRQGAGYQNIALLL